VFIGAPGSVGGTEAELKQVGTAKGDECGPCPTSKISEKEGLWGNRSISRGKGIQAAARGKGRKVEALKRFLFFPHGW